MQLRLTIFTRMLLLIVLLLSPIIVIYYISYQESTRIIKSELENSNLNQLNRLISDIENQFQELETISSILIRDSNIIEYVHQYPFHNYSLVQIKGMIMEKLNIASVSNNWANRFVLYMPQIEEAISSDFSVQYDAKMLNKNYKPDWSYSDIHYSNAPPKQGFVFYFIDRGSHDFHIDKTSLLFEVSVDSTKLKKKLMEIKNDVKGDPFFYGGAGQIIANPTANSENIRLIENKLYNINNTQGIIPIEMNHQKHFVTYVKSDMLGWYLVNYVPIEQIISPIHYISRYFYVLVSLLLLTAVLAAFLLYRNVQIPVRELIYAFQRIKLRDYSFRITRKVDNEFSYLLLQFNSMTEQIQTLIETVYLEKIQVREAQLKQLQSQIHPHFLYNSLGFIINMAKLRKNDSAIEMAHHLSDYYRYSTRVENEFPTLRDELNFIEHYLEIQCLRNNHFSYDISVPASLDQIILPRLLFQPAVENAIIHGIGVSCKPGHIRISAHWEGDDVCLSIEDNGSGMKEHEINNLMKRLHEPMTEEVGCGLWNMYHRLKYQFGEEATVGFSTSEMGGLKVMLCWIP